MKIRYAAFLFIALLIDLLQAVLGWIAFAIGLGLQAITPVGGAAAGAAAGAYGCWNTAGGVASAVIAASKCALAGGLAGALASTFGIPLGTGLGLALELIVSLTMGSALIVLLAINGMYYPTRVTAMWIVEVIPGIDVIPGWTFMVILCILKNMEEEKKLGSKASAPFASMLAPATALGAAVGSVNYIQQQKVNMVLASGAATAGSYNQGRVETRQRVNTELKNIDGIKQPYVQKTA